ncbi:hypothetical protein BDV97DRAFT_365217 [Delphinella strobiligena]|nr:hypothetical protein BDV97DRAFT_365217 [Delphinella strobiligena]
MRSDTIALFAAAAAVASASSSSGCGKSAPYKLGKLTTDTLKSDGDKRSFVVNLPSTYDKNTAAPLILSFHGNGRDALNQASTDFLYNATWNANSIVIYPEAENGVWIDAPYADKSVDDLQFTSDLLSNLSSTLCIESDQVYCTGKSIGGGMCNMLACDKALSASFAAIAPVSGAFYTTPANESFSTNCDPSHVMPVIEFHGLNDTTISYDGGEASGVDLPDIASWAKDWAVANGCDNSTSPDVSYSNGSTTEIVSYSCNGKDGIVQHYAINNLMHDWPATSWNSDNDGHSSLEAPINATIIIMEFFANWTLADTASSATTSSTSSTATASGAASSSSASTTKHTSSSKGGAAMATAFPGFLGAVALGALVL